MKKLFCLTILLLMFRNNGQHNETELSENQINGICVSHLNTIRNYPGISGCLGLETPYYLAFVHKAKENNYNHLYHILKIKKTFCYIVQEFCESEGDFTLDDRRNEQVSWQDIQFFLEAENEYNKTVKSKPYLVLETTYKLPSK